MQIRRAEAADEAALASIRHQAILELAAPTLAAHLAEEWALGAAPDRIARAIRNHDVWVAVAPKVLGWVEVAHDRVAALYVGPAFAYHGVGSRLLVHAETAMRAAGYATARLAASENALGFYLRRGYVGFGLQAPDGSYPLMKDLTAPDQADCEHSVGRVR